MSSPAAGIRLSFLPQVDQSRYENLFTQATSGRYMSSSTAKDVLSRSGLDNETLAKIWNLSSVTQDPQLSFPEFAVAMYLTSMRMTGRELPDALPISIRNEIETAVATIKSTDMNTPTINAQPTGMSSLAVPSPQQMMPTGATNISPQRSLSTSMLSSMSTRQSALPQQTGSTQQQQQQQQSQPQQPSFTGLPAPMMTGLQVPMTTGMSTNFQVPMITGVTPLMANNPQVPMPTGMHGNNLNFANMMMPGASSVGAGAQQQNFQAISGKVKIPWAVTIEEKQRYSKIFKAWDTEKKGYLSGEKAKEVFTQSGLPQNVLMQIWNLADPNNMGKLNIDEFCVAMHLIYRKLNGYDVPTTLPPELVPPSTRELKETVSELKNSILQDIATKRGLHNFSSSATLAPPNRGTARARSVSPSRTSGSRREKYKDDDNEDAGYVSSARRMGPDRSRRGQNRDGSPSPTGSKSSTTSSYGYRGKATRISDLRKQIAEQKERMKQIEQEAIARKAKPYRDLSYTEQKDIDDIKEKIRELQNEIVKAGGDDANHLWDTYSKRTAELAELTEQEKSLESEVRYLIENSVRALVRQLQETEDDLAEKKKQHAKSKVTNDGQALDIVGTGPNGEVTEQDKIRAKAKAMVAARMGKLTGKTSTVDITAELDEIEQEKTTFKEYAESIAASLQEAEDSINSIHMEISMLGMDINKHQQDQKKIDERRRFETGENVAADLKEFIQQLSFETAIARAPDVDPSFETRFPSFE